MFPRMPPSGNLPGHSVAVFLYRDNAFAGGAPFADCLGCHLEELEAGLITRAVFKIMPVPLAGDA